MVASSTNPQPGWHNTCLHATHLGMPGWSSVFRICASLWNRSSCFQSRMDLRLRALMATVRPD
jgi:hypothetical protein